VREKYCWLVADKPSEQDVCMREIYTFDKLYSKVERFDLCLQSELNQGILIDSDL
jgi:hypothetical protein